MIGLGSLYFPNTLMKEESKWIEVNNATQTSEDKEVLFEVVVPWVETKEFQIMQKLGVYFLQAFTGMMLAFGAKALGRHELYKFIIGCIWIICRIVIVVFSVALCRILLKSHEGPLYRYGIYLICKFFVDLYFFIIVRYFCMECYDLYRYQKTVNTVIRREPPKSGTKTAKKGHAKKKKGEKRASQLTNYKTEGDRKHKKSTLIDEEPGPAPVWDRKNEIIFYGEDYTDWDPALFLARWETLNERAEETVKTVKNRSKAASKTGPSREVSVVKDNDEPTPDQEKAFPPGSKRKSEYRGGVKRQSRASARFNNAKVFGISKDNNRRPEKDDAVPTREEAGGNKDNSSGRRSLSKDDKPNNQRRQSMQIERNKAGGVRFHPEDQVHNV